MVSIKKFDKSTNSHIIILFRAIVLNPRGDWLQDATSI